MIYDICIIGAGPVGIACLNELVNNYNKNVILIEEIQPFNSLKNYMNNMTWHSPWKVCKLENKEFENVNRDEHPKIEQLIKKYDEFIIEKKLFDKIIIDEILSITNENNICKINSKYQDFYSKSVLIATGFYKYPKKITFPIINSVTYRTIKNYEHINNKRILCIGGGFSSCDLSVKLNVLNNSIVILTHNKNKVLSNFNEQKTVWGQPDISLKNISIQEYKNISKIENNTIYFDNIKLSFDICYIFIGYNRNYTDIKIDSSINSKVKIVSAYVVQDLYGGICKKGTKRPKLIDGFIKLILNV